MAKKKTTDKAKPDAAPPFEESLAELEAIVGDLEGGELGLGDALARYEAGVTRLKQCHGQLEAAERRIELLSGVDADGNAVTTPFDGAPSEVGQGAAGGRSRKRSAPARGSGDGAAPAAGGEDVDDRARLF